MNCLDFRKNINEYLNKSLTDEELYEFLRHLDSCEKCREELEINYIVTEGVRKLDEDEEEFNLSLLFGKNLAGNIRHLKLAAWLRRLSYIVDTLAFWSFLIALVLFLRVSFSG